MASVLWIFELIERHLLLSSSKHWKKNRNIELSAVFPCFLFQILTTPFPKQHDKSRNIFKISVCSLPFVLTNIYSRFALHFLNVFGVFTFNFFRFFPLSVHQKAFNSIQMRNNECEFSRIWGLSWHFLFHLKDVRTLKNYGVTEGQVVEKEQFWWVRCFFLEGCGLVNRKDFLLQNFIVSNLRHLDFFHG